MENLVLRQQLAVCLRRFRQESGQSAVADVLGSGDTTELVGPQLL